MCWIPWRLFWIIIWYRCTWTCVLMLVVIKITVFQPLFLSTFWWFSKCWKFHTEPFIKSMGVDCSFFTVFDGYLVSVNSFTLMLYLICGLNSWSPDNQIHFKLHFSSVEQSGGTLNRTLSFIRWWVSSSGALGSVESLLCFYYSHTVEPTDQPTADCDNHESFTLRYLSL